MTPPKSFETWYLNESENAKRCCDSCYNTFINSEVNIKRGYEAGYAHAMQSQEVAGLVEQVRAVIAWQKRLSEDHSEKLGKSFEEACENWNDLDQTMFDFKDMQEALAKFEGRE